MAAIKTANHSRVFSENWVAAQQREFGNLYPYQQPSLFALWTSPDFQNRRDEIEELASLVHGKRRAGLIQRLRTPRTFFDTLNELYVGRSFVRLGHAIQYEPDLDQLTPDWLVTSPDGATMIVDVYTSRPSDARRDQDASWERLRRLLESVQGAGFLHLKIPFAGDDEVIFAPNDEEQFQIAKSVEYWLASNPADNSILETRGVTVTFIASRPGLDRVHCGLGGVGFWVDSKPLWKGIKEKASKYRHLVQSRREPFVVCVIPDFTTGRGMDDLAQIVLGTVNLRLTFPAGRSAVHNYYRLDDGLFREYPGLSGVTLFNSDLRVSNHTLVVNEFASFPIDPRFFG